MGTVVEFNGELVDFPDTMSDADIEKVLSGMTQEPPQGGTIADSLGQGALFGFSDEIAGGVGAAVNSALNLLGKGTGESFGDAYRGIRDSARDNAAAFAERNPGTDLGLQVVGGLVTGGAGAARAGAFHAAKNAPTLAGRLRPIVSTGAVQGGAYGAGTSGADMTQGGTRELIKDATSGAAVGAATAPLLPILAGSTKAIAPKVISAKTGDNFNNAVRLLKDKAGIALTTAQKTGSDALRTLESTLAPTFVGQRISATLDNNRIKFQGKLMEMAGFRDKFTKSGAVTREALDDAQDEFSKRYAAMLGDKSVDLSEDKFLNRLASVEGENLANLPTFQKKQVKDLVDDFLDTAIQGPMTAKTYQKTRSRLGKLAKSSKANQPHLSQVYRDMKRALDEAFADAAGEPGLRKDLDKQYGRFKQLLSAFESSGSQQSSEGILPLSMILRRSRKHPDREFEEMVEAGQMVLGDPTPNSGTASRALNNALAFGSGPATFFDPTLGAATLGVPFGTSQILSRGLTGSATADKLVQSGLITTPVLNPLVSE